jgi:hypothetical protein
MPFQAAALLLYPDLLEVCLCATLISHATFATARKNKAELLSIFRLALDVFVKLPEPTTPICFQHRHLCSVSSPPPTTTT